MNIIKNYEYVSDVKTKNGKRGAIVMDNDLDNILKDCLSWIRKENLKAGQVAKSIVYEFATSVAIGEIKFVSDSMAEYEPYTKY